MSTKMGQKRSGVKAYPMKRTPIKKVSKKQAAENAELKKLTDKLRELCRVPGNVAIPIYQSELTGHWVNHLDPHHLAGRGKNLLNVFRIIMISRFEHIDEQKHMSYAHKQELLTKIKVIRLAQGFKLEDYE